jgi:pilus assembly protein CpaC
MIIETKEPGPIKRVHLAAPEIAGSVLIPPRQVYLIGKKAGVTSLSLWIEEKKNTEEKNEENKSVEEKLLCVLDVRISPDLSGIRAKLREILPGEKIRVTATHDGITLYGEVSNETNLALAEKLAEAYAPKKVINLLQVRGVHEAPLALSPFLLDQLKAKLHEILPDEAIRVTTTHDGITLYGEVSGATKLSRALALAEAYAPKKVINLLQVSGVHQVMLEVRVAEMSRSLTRRLQISGLGLSYGAFVNGGFLKFGLLNELTAFATSTFPASALFSFGRGGLDLTGFIDALKEEGVVKILAEPTLVTLSGQEASFLAGGEFPVPVPQDFNTLTIQFKTFGVGLKFTPTVLSKSRISMRVAPEVSDLDFTNAITVAGFRVPALDVRRAATVIELDNGQSFAIAGLLNDTVREVISKFPALGDIPILGALFRSSSFQKDETELIIIVTPHLVQPLEQAQQPLPTDQFIEPNDLEFFLQGRTEGRSMVRLESQRLDGAFGYLYGPLEETP